MVAWTRECIYNNIDARHYFQGDDCVLCTAAWENTRRENCE
jgi:hypothetical protein